MTQIDIVKLWAIMLRNSNDLFIAQSTSRKFLDTIEDLLSSARTSPVVRERLLEVVAAAAYASGNKKGSDREGFKGLWRRVKPFDKPDEGVPFDTDDAMFNPPTATTVGGRVSGFDVPTVLYQEASPLPEDSAPNTPVPNPHLNANPNGKRRKSPTRNNRIIPLDEDMRRLFQECKIAQGNASLLAQALALAKPEELKKQDIIKEFYAKCRASQELIFAQIPWASSLAEKSIAMRDKDRDRDKHGRSRKVSSNDSHTNNTAAVNGKATDPPPPLDATIEEQLLAALLAANAELMEALKVYDDLKRVALERRIEDQSRRDARSARRARDQLPAEPLGSDAAFGSRERERSRSRSRTPSPESRSNSPYPSTLTQPNPHPHPQIHAHAPPAHTHAHVQPRSLPVPMSLPDPEQNLAPPPAAPHGPRLPAHGASSQHSVRSVHSRTPSPGSPARDKFGNGNTKYYADSVSSHTAVVNGNVQGDGEEEEEEEYFYPTKPSAKALGKRKLVEPEPDPTFPASGNGASFDPDDIYYGIGGGAGGGGGRDHPPFGVGAGHDDDDDEDDDSRGREYTLFRPKVNFVYDAVAEREMMRMRMLQEQQQQQLVATNGVH
uniref:VHS domain-containing protein n=1 Tax=Psilocybe cubensis TaxID=181762 RepID=A0A8H8CFZ1_PSICU